MSLFGIISPVPTADSVNNIEKLGGDATYAKEFVDYTIKVSEHGHSVFSILLVVLSVILVVVALVFLIRKNIQLANYTYLAYVFVPSLVLSTTLSAFRMRFHFFTDP